MKRTARARLIGSDDDIITDLPARIEVLDSGENASEEPETAGCDVDARLTPAVQSISIHAINTLFIEGVRRVGRGDCSQIRTVT